MPRGDHPPAFLFYPEDFSSDSKVEAMTTEEVGAYTLLLCKSWREDPPGSIPADDAVLARWARLTPDRWSECRAGVLAAFKLGTDARWHQKRLRNEYRAYVERKKEKQRAGKVGAKARWSNKLHSTRIAQPLAKHGSSSSFASSLKEKSKEGAAQHPAPPSPPHKNIAWEQYQERERIAAERSAHKKGKPKGRTYNRPSVQPPVERPIHETPAERKSRVSRETVDRAIRNIRERREREQRPVSGLHGCAGGDYGTGDRASVSGSSPPQEQRLSTIAG